MDDIRNLEPREFWAYFLDVCAVPRPSEKEDKMTAYLMGFAEKQGLEAQKDKAGNVLIRKPASPGMEDRKSVLLQSHQDMVPEKNKGVEHNFDTDPIQPYIDGKWLRAKGTTLGADDGAGVAAQLAILASKDIPHGPMECLFTVGEETGLIGAFALEPGFVKSRILINLDSEDWGIFFFGSAGGNDTMASFKPEYDQLMGDYTYYTYSISGLTGGHSGDDIEKGRANAIKLLVRLLWTGIKEYGLEISGIQGGSRLNAIPREAEANIAIPNDKKAAFEKYAAQFANDIANEYKTTEPKLKALLEAGPEERKIFSASFRDRFIQCLYTLPHGPLAMSMTVKALVETSSNMASVYEKNGMYHIETNQRSSVMSALLEASERAANVFRLARADKQWHAALYPGWEPNPDSEIVKITKDAYVRLFGEEPVIRAVHAGLECGVIGEKYPGMDMVSVGPTVDGVHSPDERMELETVPKYWNHLLEIIKNVPKK